MVIHCNHPNELDDSVRTAVDQLRQIGVTLLNQTVLLKGINDQPETLCELSERLFAIGVMPYYLHVMDPVAGGAHFAIPDHKARRIIGKVSACLPGYLVPKLVREIPEQPAKSPLQPIF